MQCRSICVCLVLWLDCGKAKKNLFSNGTEILTICDHSSLIHCEISTTHGLSSNLSQKRCQVATSSPYEKVRSKIANYAGWIFLTFTFFVKYNIKLWIFGFPYKSYMEPSVLSLYIDPIYGQISAMSKCRYL